jgi:hypothetical protein
LLVLQVTVLVELLGEQADGWNGTPVALSETDFRLSVPEGVTV